MNSDPGASKRRHGTQTGQKRDSRYKSPIFALLFLSEHPELYKICILYSYVYSGSGKQDRSSAFFPGIRPGFIWTPRKARRPFSQIADPCVGRAYRAWVRMSKRFCRRKICDGRDRAPRGRSPVPYSPSYLGIFFVFPCQRRTSSGLRRRTSAKRIAPISAPSVFKITSSISE